MRRPQGVERAKGTALTLFRYIATDKPIRYTADAESPEAHDPRPMLLHYMLKSAKALAMPLIVACLALPTIQLHAQDVYQTIYMGNTINFTVDGNEAKIVSSPVSGDVKLPSYVSDEYGNSYPVAAIGNRAFSGKSAITSITIPNTVTAIGEEAFYGCSSLRYLTIPASVTSVGNYAFCGDDKSAILQVYFEGATPPEFGYSYIPDGVTVVYVPEGCWSAYQSALNWFSPKDNLVETSEAPEPFDIISYTHEGVTLEYVVKDKKFKEVITRPRLGVSYSLSGSVVVPFSITNGGDEYIVVGTGTESFSGCSSITSITFPSYRRFEIGKRSFEGCSGLTSLSFPTAVILNDGSFRNCTGLTTAFEPNGAYGATYEGCTGIKSINFADHIYTIPANEFASCSGLTEVIIPDEVERINSMAFYDCTSLTTLTLGSSVSIIESRTFKNCSAISTIISLNTVPPTCNATAFDNVPASATLFVPKGSKQSYVDDAVWSRFENVQEIADVVFGDANGDGAVTVEDVVLTVQHILGNTPSNFKSANADVDRNGEVNISDVTAIVGIILKAD